MLLGLQEMTPQSLNGLFSVSYLGSGKARSSFLKRERFRLHVIDIRLWVIRVS